MAALGDSIETSCETTEKLNTKGEPEYLMEWIALSVKIRISCRVLIAPMIADPPDNT